MSFRLHDPRQWLTFVPQTLHASPLYSEVWEHLKDDPELLEFVALVDTDQPLPITFFTGVNALVLAEVQHPLARFYPFLHQEEAPPLSEAYPCFREFVLAHSEQLRSLLPTARLQTNEVTRCSNLLPAFCLAYQRGGNRPLNMIEIGSSAGLNLLWHRYCYHYGSVLMPEDAVRGEQASPVHIHCQLGGLYLPSLPKMLPRVACCQGIELVPRNLHSEADMRWIRAAIWPEEQARHHLLDAAITLARQTPLHLHTGDACERLPELLAALPDDQTAVIWHSYALHQGPMRVKEVIERQIEAASHRLPIYRISLEVVEASGPKLELMTYEKGALVTREHLANCAIHGERMTWLLETR